MVFLILFTQATPTDFALFGVKKKPIQITRTFPTNMYDSRSKYLHKNVSVSIAV